VKEVGTALGKAVHIALTPIWLMDWGYKKAGDYLNSILPEKLKDIPPERIVTPNPAVIGPAVDALRFAVNMDEPDLREMYANLIATSMDKETARNAHPAFAEIIRQMVADEAKIFTFIATAEPINVSDISLAVYTPDDNLVIHDNISGYRYIDQRCKCAHPDLIPSYLDNLRRLGITQHREDGWRRITRHPDGTLSDYRLNADSLPTPVIDIGLIAMVKSLIANEFKIYSEKVVEFSALSEVVELSSLGSQFANACVFPPK
jgi:abortive infection alpha-like protein